MEARVSQGIEFFSKKMNLKETKRSPELLYIHATISKPRRHIRDRLINYPQFFQKNIKK
jgi:hypothetical protein